MAKSTRDDFAGVRYRSLDISPASINETNRSVEAVFATETPVVEYDYDRYDYVPTVLLASGCQLPKDRTLVMLDNHQRHGEVAENIKGSGVNCRIENRQLVGDLVFSSLAVDEWTLAKEGHIKGVSIGRTDEKSVYVGDGQSTRLDGKSYDGPCRIVTSWTPREISLTPVGADKNALLRSDQPEGREAAQEPNARGQSNRSAQHRSLNMTAILKALLISRGLKKDATDEDAVAFLVERGMPLNTESDKLNDWAAANLDKLSVHTEPETEPKEPVVETRGLPERKTEPDYDAIAERVLQKAEKSRIEARKAIESHVKVRNEKLKWDDATISRIAANATSIKDVDEAIFTEIAERAGPKGQLGGAIITGYGQEQSDKFGRTVATALSLRTLECVVKDRATIDAVFPKEQRHQGWEEFRYASLLQLAAFSLRQQGVRPDFMAPEDIAKAALFGIRHDHGFRVRSGAYHTPGSFPYILMDAINKSLQAAYSEAPSTCETWVRMAPSVPDFKNINVLKLGATPNLQDWDGYSRLPTVSFKDEKEYYAVQAKAERVPISWMTIVNDDQNALSTVPARLGAAARRTRNQMAYAQLTMGTSANGRTMSDGQQLFSTATGNRAKANLSTGAGAPSVSTVQTVSNWIAQQRGLNTPEEATGEDILGNQPAFIIAPTALRTTVLQLVRSTADPASGGNAGVYNPTQGLIPVIEPFLDGSSTTAWYLATRWQDCPHVEITHLVGQEVPVIESWIDDNTKALMYDCIQTMAACAVEHRGIAKHAGA